MEDGNRPFIYISSLMRTGSTVLSEALTRFPYSFIFREPHLGKNYYALKDVDAEVFAKRDVDIRQLVHLTLVTASEQMSFGSTARKLQRSVLTAGSLKRMSRSVQMQLQCFVIWQSTVNSGA